MSITINAKDLRASLPKVVERVRKGDRFTVLYRSRPAFRIVPIDDVERATSPLEQDPLYKAKALGRSKDGRSSADHDDLLYPR